MDEVASFTVNVVVLMLICAALEFLLPNGKMRDAARVGTGLLFAAYVAERILHVAAQWGI